MPTVLRVGPFRFFFSAGDEVSPIRGRVREHRKLQSSAAGSRGQRVEAAQTVIRVAALLQRLVRRSPRLGPSTSRIAIVIQPPRPMPDRLSVQSNDVHGPVRQISEVLADGG